MTALRNAIRDLADGKDCQHAGLALERYVETVADEQKQHVKMLIDNVMRIGISEEYKRSYQRFSGFLQQAPHAQSDLFTVLDRLAVGLGGDSVLETAITLHHTYGVPYIPGSALKGLARHYFLREIACAQKEGELKEEDRAVFSVLFGDNESKGYITFFDGWFAPPNNSASPLRADILTPHHMDYYSDKGKSHAPTDFDDPIPNAFVSAVGSYRIAVQGPDDEWAKYAFELLSQALRDYGVGGKTSSGYGRLVPTSEYTPPKRALDEGQFSRRDTERTSPLTHETPAALSKVKHTKLATPPPKPQSVVTKEQVTIVGQRAGKCLVKTEQGEQISCSGVPGYIMRDVLQAEITRENGKAVRAKFLRWW